MMRTTRPMIDACISGVILTALNFGFDGFSQKSPFLRFSRILTV
jgi:hypothetical protein